MSGIKQFDEGVALDRAMQTFWRNGFNGTSYPDLMQATGLNKSSLYNSFGDKQALYQRCLTRFSEVHGGRLRSRLDAPRVHDAIGGFFDELIGRFRRADLPGGCMVTAAAVELGGDHDDAGPRIREQMRELETLFRKRLQRAVAEGELPRTTDVSSLASLLLAMTRGLAALHRGYADVRAVRRAKQAMMQLLKAPPLKGRMA
jgi:AcrR family transcriptional regulator